MDRWKNTSHTHNADTTNLLTYISSLVLWAQVMLHHATCEATSKHVCQEHKISSMDLCVKDPGSSSVCSGILKLSSMDLVPEMIVVLSVWRVIINASVLYVLLPFANSLQKSV